MDVDKVSAAVEQGKSIRKSAKLLGRSYTWLQWWLLKNGYRIEHYAKLVKVSQQSKEN